MNIKVKILGLILAVACSQTAASAEFVDPPASSNKPAMKMTKIKSGTFEGVLNQDDHFLDGAINKDPLCVQWFSKLKSKAALTKLALQVRGHRARLQYTISGDVNMNGVAVGRINRQLPGAAHFQLRGRLPLVGYEAVDRITLIQQENGKLLPYIHITEEINGSTGAPFCETAYN